MEANILSYNKNANIAEARTQYGILHCVWKGQNEPELKRYIVELASDDIVKCGQINKNGGIVVGISEGEKGFLICGIVDDIENDLIVVSIEGEQIMISVDKVCGVVRGDKVSFYLKELQLWDTEIL